jgi:hypothetical protein
MDWTCREVLDAKAVAPDGVAKCEFCGTKIRWIHVLEHDDYHRSVETGCCCASRLCFDYDAEAAEREIKNRVSRLMRFVDPRRWTRSRANPENIWRWVRLSKRRKERVTVYLKNGEYGIYLSGASHFDRYGSQAEAKNMAFELVEQLKSEDAG